MNHQMMNSETPQIRTRSPSSTQSDDSDDDVFAGAELYAQKEEPNIFLDHFPPEDKDVSFSLF